MTERILVTGGAGFIGSNFVRSALARGYAVDVLDRLDTAGDLTRLEPLRSSPHLRIGFHDLRAEIKPAHFPGPYKYIVHMAAGSHVPRSVLDPMQFVADNVTGTAHLLEFARLHHPGTKVLYFSTDEVFGPARTDETFGAHDAHHPNNPYAATKAAAEQLCPAWANTYGMPIVLTHCTNVYGPGQDAEKFIPLVSAKIRRGETVQIHARDGVPSSRAYIHVDDVCNAVWTVLDRGGVIGGRGTGKYNIAGSSEYGNDDVAQYIAGQLGLPLRMELVEHIADRPRHDQRYALDGLGLRELGWEPRVLLFDGIRRLFGDSSEAAA